MNTIDSTHGFVELAYANMESRLAIARRWFQGPMTLADKILLGHFNSPETQRIGSGVSYVNLLPDRVALQDVTGQMTILQFVQSGRRKTAVPTTVHCDHLIQAREEGVSDTNAALTENEEVFSFLQSSAEKYGMGFWKPGAGIIHQVVLENYAFPGGLMIGTDSHTPNAGGLGMIAVGVGGADAAEVMSGLPWEVQYPGRIGVMLTGTLNSWTSPKDVILHLAGLLSVKGGTNSIIEYFGPGTSSISCTGKATICNMGAELGATSSIFPFDARMDTYLRATGRVSIADLSNQKSHLLNADPAIQENPHEYFDKVIEIDLSELEPQIVGPHTPDLARPISKMAKEITTKGYVDKISDSLIGSCTNSSYEDMSRAADIAEQGRSRGMTVKTPLLVTPGSEQVRATTERDGQISSLRSVGATVLANACGPCIGQWKRKDLSDGKENTILTSFNRNFPKRNDGRQETMSFIASPEIVTALALAGRLSFNPLTDKLIDANGNLFKLDPPKQAPEVPPNGFKIGEDVYVPPPLDGDSVELVIDPKSNRLQALKPFPAWDGNDFVELPVLLKAKGKCTTDHISPAGPWLRFRGHLDNLSDNMFLGAINAYSEETGKGYDYLTGERSKAFSAIARNYKSKGIRWVVVGDENYGEGSSREHAAMSPRLLGAAAVIVRSFARIHESNLKKQGILPLTFGDPEDYNLLQEDDKISLIDLGNLCSGIPLTCRISHSDGTSHVINVSHTLNQSQIEWFKAGGALNLLRQQT